jgi:hypothetical protein
MEAHNTNLIVVTMPLARAVHLKSTCKQAKNEIIHGKVEERENSFMFTLSTAG